MAMRDPHSKGWPDRGEKTELKEFADRWAWGYLDWVRSEQRRKTLRLGKDPSLRKAAETFLVHRENVRERSTWAASRTAVNHLLSQLAGDRKLSDIESSEIQALVDEMLNEGYKASTLKTYTKDWWVFFKHFGGWNPVEDVTVSTKADKADDEARTFDPEEIAQLFRAAEKVDSLQVGLFPSAVLAVGVGLWMGLRQGEIFALSWSDIDRETATVRIRFQVPKDSTDLKATKGKMSRTALILPGWWERHRRDSIGFVVGRMGKPSGSRTQRNLITRVLDTSGLNQLGLGWHALRHTYARNFIELGGRFEELQKSLGHKSITTTETRYGNFHEDIAAKLAKERIYGDRA